jgi:hypothetical protein
VGLLLTVCGLFLVGYGVWRAAAAARRIVVPTVHPGRPSGVGRAGWDLVLAVAWISVAMLGLFMASMAGRAR